uniref:Immunoglobulin heavy constant mu n=1 Tax=Catharus ustulatus TaxID=91951 RepID=A0A8C3UDZ8_CATUS
MAAEEGKARQPFRCRARGARAERSAEVSNPDSPRIPIPTELTLHPPAREDFQGPFRNSTLLCRLRGPRRGPGAAPIRWLRNGAELRDGVTAEPPAAEPSGAFVTGSRLVVTESEWDRGDVFTCQADEEMRNTSKAMECGYDQPLAAGEIRVEPVPPLFADIFRDQAARLTCRVSNLPPGVEGLDVAWLKEDGEPLATKTSAPSLQANGLLAAEGVATVSVEAWESGQTFTCRVLHPELLFPREVTMRKTTSPDASPPSLYLLPPPPEQLRARTWATLTCLLRDFNPPDVLVQWLQDGRPLPQNRALTFRPRPDTGHAPSGHAHLALSALTVPWRDWDAGSVFTCLVGHERLPLRLAQKSLDKSAALVAGVGPDEDEDLGNLWATASTFIVLFILSLFYSATVTLIKVK